MKRLHLAFSVLFLILAAWPAAGETPLYLDASQPVAARVDDLLGRMTLAEKAAALDKSQPVERLGIFADGWNQCLNGVVWDSPTTQFPVPIAMAATWDTLLVREAASVISDEARAIYNGWRRDAAFKGEKKGLFYRSPVVNISRNPYWGRIAECFGEDNFLTGRIGVAYVKGLQGDDPDHLKVAATLKHFAVNNVETGRMSLNAMVSERMLYEYWLPHFRDCVVDGGAMSVMASYNAVNSVPATINRLLLTDILKNTWGFKGFVVSDYDGIKQMVEGHEKGEMAYPEAVAKALNAGCDFSDKEFSTYIPQAMEQGLLRETRLDDALRRVLRVRFLLGEFDEPSASPYASLSPDIIRSEPHRAVSLRAAQEAVVLLTNRDGILPLGDAVKTVAVIGPHADRMIQNRYSGKIQDAVTPLQGIRNKAGKGVKVLHAVGCDLPMIDAEKTYAKQLGAAEAGDPAAALAAAVAAAKQADVAVVFVGTSRAIEDEGRDRTSLGLPEAEQALVEAVCAANPKTIVVLMSGGPLAVPWIKEHAAAVLQGWLGAEQQGDAIASVLFGDCNPAGRLPYTMYASESQVPPVDEYDITKGFTYMYLKGEPLYAFGHGLSYTTFEYADLQTDSESLAGEGGVLEVTLNVTNTGKRDGDEVVQLYIHPPRMFMQRPERFLAGFARVALKAGETRQVTLRIKGEQLAYWSVGEQGYVVQPGTYELQAGASSADIRLKKSIEVTEY